MNQSQPITMFVLTVLILNFNFNVNAQIQKGLDIDGEAVGDKSGRSVSMPDSSTIAIGAYFNDGNGTDAGNVRIFLWYGSTWVQKGMDIDGEAAGDVSGWAVGMPDSNTIAIGAPGNDGSGTNAGQVRIYSWNGSSWVQKGMDIDGEAAGDQTGSSLSMPDSNTIAIGAYGNDGNGTDAGHVRIYSWNGSSWMQKGMDIDGEAAGDVSGWAVSMHDSNTVTIGAPGNDGNGPLAGNVRIFTWNSISGTWVQKGLAINGEDGNDHAGNSVYMPDINTVAIGAVWNAGNGTWAGNVRIYSWNVNTWNQKGMDIDGETAYDQSGHSVTMPNSNTVAIGAVSNDANGTDAGHVRIFSWNGSLWVQKGMDIDGEAAGDQSGFSLSMPDTNTVAIGAINNEGNGAEAGHVRIYSLSNTSVSLNPFNFDFENALIIYPNPTNGIFTLSLGSEYTDIEIIIRNELGQEINSLIFNNLNKVQVLIPGEAGIYFVEISADNKRSLMKVKKE